MPSSCALCADAHHLLPPQLQSFICLATVERPTKRKHTIARVPRVINRLPFPFGASTRCNTRTYYPSQPLCLQNHPAYPHQGTDTNGRSYLLSVDLNHRYIHTRNNTRDDDAQNHLSNIIEPAQQAARQHARRFPEVQHTHTHQAGLIFATRLEMN